MAWDRLFSKKTNQPNGNGGAAMVKSVDKLVKEIHELPDLEKLR
jgi:hypothetical protein